MFLLKPRTQTKPVCKSKSFAGARSASLDEVLAGSISNCSRFCTWWKV